MKRILSLILAMLMVFSLLPLSAMAASKAPEAASGSVVHINPTYAHCVSEASLTGPSRQAPSYGDVKYYSNKTDFYKVVRSAMEERDTSFSVGYKLPYSSFTSNFPTDHFYNSLDYAFVHTGVPTQGDYIYYNYAGCYGSWEWYTQNGTTYIAYTYDVNYNASASQEKTVDSQVSSLLSQLGTSGSNYQKIKRVYDWMTKNIRYDYDHLNDTSYRLQYSAYAALVNKKAVCQGYALLLYRLALEMDIDCRMVPSIEAENHVWNIVSMGNLYYNCDATWDEGCTTYSWFLRSNSGFPDHTRDAAYRTTSFNEEYPMGSTNYNPNTAATIKTQPKSVAVAKGETAKVTVKASGDGLTYKWYYKDADASKYSLTTSFTGNSYSVKMSSDRNGRKVYCKITDKYGNTVKTNTVTLSMATPLKITTQPKNVTVMKGETAKVTLKATGDGLTYKWYYKNAGDDKYTYTSSFKSNSYSVEMTSARNGRRVLCKVYDKYGNMVQSDSVVLKMAKPVYIKTQPVSVTVKKGETAKVSVTAVGDGLTYRWYYKDAGATKYTYTDSFKSNTYSVTMTAARNGRKLICKVYDKYGNMVQTNTVTIKMK